VKTNNWTKRKQDRVKWKGVVEKANTLSKNKVVAPEKEEEEEQQQQERRERRILYVWYPQSKISMTDLHVSYIILF
jgi:hypothetical protein